MRRNAASQIIGAQLVSATDGSAFTGAVTVAVTGDGGTQATGSVGSGACTHEGGGFHSYTPAQAETNYAHVAFTFTGTGAVPATVQVYPTVYDASGIYGVNMTHIAGASVSTSTAQLGVNVVNAGGAAITAASGRMEVNTSHFAGTAITATAGIPSVNTVQWRGTQPNILVSGRVDSSVGAMAADVVTAAAIAADAIGASELAAGAASEIAAAVLASVAEAQGSYTVQQILSIILAACAGETTGTTFLTPNGVATRIDATVVANERTAVTLTPSA